MGDEPHNTIPDRSGQAEADYASAYHDPVLCKAVVSGLVGATDGTYVDATLGGGGHTAALLDVLGETGRVIGIDRDADALAVVRVRLAAHVDAGRLQLARSDFQDIATVLNECGVDRIDGLLLDLGVSSHQLDQPDRGFSHRFDGPLDMRMDDRGAETAADILNGSDIGHIARILRRYGEEPSARSIARSIVSRRPLDSTKDLVRAIEAVTSPPSRSKTLARVFQGLRIAVNGELESLEATLEAATRLMQPGGRIAVISYHSLEDRRVKRFLRYGNFEGRPVRSIMGDLEAPWRPVSNRPIMPTEEETARNPRARSARLRLAERLDHPFPSA